MHKLDGTRSRAPTARGDAAPSPARTARSRRVPSAPAWLGDHARQYWRQHAPMLHAAGRLEPQHVAAFATLCVSYDLYRTAAAAVPRRIRGKHFPPAIAAMRQALRDMMALSLRFGLDPASDARLLAVSGGGPVGSGAEPPAATTPAAGGPRDAAWQARYSSGA